MKQKFCSCFQFLFVLAYSRVFNHVSSPPWVGSIPRSIQADYSQLSSTEANVGWINMLEGMLVVFCRWYSMTHSKEISSPIGLDEILSICIQVVSDSVL
jgi:hypothetical protein